MQRKNYGYKRPTPVGIQYDKSFNALDRAVFREILALCDNKDRPCDFWHGNKHYTIELKKGQCVFKVKKFSEEMEIGHKRVRKSIEKLKKWYTEVETEAKPYGVLVSLKDYDSIVKMETEVESDGKVTGNRRETEGRASITDDIEVTDEEEEEELSGFEKFWNQYQKKTGRAKCKAKWNRMVTKEREAALDSVAAYVASTPNVTYRKDPLTWLNGKHWEDELSQIQTQKTDAEYKKELEQMGGNAFREKYRLLYEEPLPHTVKDVKERADLKHMKLYFRISRFFEE